MVWWSHYAQQGVYTHSLLGCDSTPSILNTLLGFSVLKKDYLRLFEIIWEYKNDKRWKVCGSSVDFCEAFDSISWMQMEAILCGYQIPEELI